MLLKDSTANSLLLLTQRDQAIELSTEQREMRRQIESLYRAEKQRREAEAKGGGRGGGGGGGGKSPAVAPLRRASAPSVAAAQPSLGGTPEARTPHAALGGGASYASGHVTPRLTGGDADECRQPEASSAGLEEESSVRSLAEGSITRCLDLGLGEVSGTASRLDEASVGESVYATPGELQRGYSMGTALSEPSEAREPSELISSVEPATQPPRAAPCTSEVPDTAPRPPRVLRAQPSSPRGLATPSVLSTATPLRQLRAADEADEADQPTPVAAEGTGPHVSDRDEGSEAASTAAEAAQLDLGPIEGGLGNLGSLAAERPAPRGRPRSMARRQRRMPVTTVDPDPVDPALRV